MRGQQLRAVSAFLVSLHTMLWTAAPVRVKIILSNKKTGGIALRKYRCLCCGYLTLESRGEFDICPVCYWEDDTYFDFSRIGEETAVTGAYFDREPAAEELLDKPSGANHGLTLRAAQENYRSFGACEKEMLAHVRKPRGNER